MSRCSTAVAAIVCAAAVTVSAPAFAQVARNFPANALRGEVSFGIPPEITLNGKAQRLAPGSRIRGLNNMLVMSGALAGSSKVAVNYTLDNIGLVMDVWLLRDEEIKNLWPKTPEEAAAWSFDPAGQIWTKP